MPSLHPAVRVEFIADDDAASVPNAISGAPSDLAALVSPRQVSHQGIVTLQHHTQPLCATNGARPKGVPLPVNALRDVVGLFATEPELCPLDPEPSSSDKRRVLRKTLDKAAASQAADEAAAERGSTLGRWCPPLRPLGRFVRSLNPQIPRTNDTGSSLVGSWFLSPEQHALEYLVVNVAFASVLAYFGLDLAQFAPSSSFAAASGANTLSVLTGMLLLSFAYAIHYKWRTGSLIFLLQPCHIVTLVELCILLAPRTYSAEVTVLFNLMLYWIWNPLIAVLQPDLRDYTKSRDIFNFFFQHALIIGIPFYLLFTRQFDFYHFSLPTLAVAFSLQVLYHFWVLESVNLVQGTNLNYMMSPPPGPLTRFGFGYRVVMTCFSLAIMLGQRLVLVDAAQHCFGDALFDRVLVHLP